jgi:AraC-like DNA-binding protein/mannose-6-phosphate isomerase-like protein (cupin superfamily)
MFPPDGVSLIKKQERENRRAFATLLSAGRGLRFVPQDIARQLDKRGRYELQLDKEFPFRVTLFQVSSKHHTPVANWHERLEIFMPLDGPIRLRMGEQLVEVAAGDLLVVDNLKLHNLEDFRGFKTRLIVISFLPEFVYGSGSPSCDYAFLVPFYAKQEGHPYVLRAADDLAAPAYLALAELLQRYFHSKDLLYSQAGCKASFLQILFCLTRRFQASEVLRSEYLRHRHQAERLAQLFEFVRQNYAERMSIKAATQMVHMSQAQFMKVFKKVSGMTFVAHVTRVRIMKGLQLLRETDLTIAEIAARCGFSDQSYFDRRFRQAFGKSPREWRRSHAEAASSISGKRDQEGAELLSDHHLPETVAPDVASLAP